jgi:hypothetical protein
MVFNSIRHLLNTSESILVEEPQATYESAFLKRSFQAWLQVPTGGIFQKFRKDGLSPKKNFDRMDKALERELWRDGAVRAGFYDAKNTSIFSLKYDPCRSEPARDGVVSDNKNVE